MAAAVLVACGGSDATDFFGGASGAGAGAATGQGGSGAATGQGAAPGDGGSPAASGGSGLTANGGSSAGTTSSQAGAGGQPSFENGGGGQGGSGGEGGVFDPCAGPEYCDGRDNDCDEVVDGEGICPADCVGLERDGRGYMLCDVTGNAVEARAACKAEDSRLDLVRLNSAEEETWLLEQLDELDINVPVWLGATDAAVEGEWRWGSGSLFYVGTFEDGMPVGGAYENWLDDQPNDADDGGEDCAILVPAQDGWNDVHCEEEDDFAIACEARR